MTSSPTPSYLAVPRAAAPRADACQAFEKGHNAHPMQVALAMKEVGDDHRFLAVRVASATVEDVGRRAVARLVLQPVADGASTEPAGDGSPIDVLHHEPALVEALGRVADDFFVWEPRYGVLFVMTDQGRDVLGTGALTLAEAEMLTDCVLPAPA